MPGGYVRGRKIIGETEYNDAVEDSALIDRIKAETDMNDPVAVRELYSRMQSGEIVFRSVVGRDFDDEIYELIQKFDRMPAKKEPEKKHISLSLPGRSKNNKQGSDKTQSDKKKSGKSTDGRPESGKSGNFKPGSGRDYSSKLSKVEDKIRQEGSVSVDQAAAKLLKKANRRRKIIMILAGVVAAGSLVYFIIYSRSAYTAQHAYDELASLKGTDPITDDIEQKPLYTLAEADQIPDILDEYKNIYIKNKSVIGWLTIDDTNIDYPVMQTVNNEYYLTHDFEGNDDNNGALFMDCNCNAMFRSDNLIIYGHHMKSGKMFGGLKKYADEDYCKEHQFISFDTIYEKSKYQVMYVFKADITNAEDVSFKYYQFIDAASQMEFDSNMEAMARMSLFDTGVTAEYGDQLLTLSTCDGSTSTTRFVVVAKRIDE